jgi:hypothetical protein
VQKILDGCAEGNVESCQYSYFVKFQLIQERPVASIGRQTPIRAMQFRIFESRGLSTKVVSHLFDVHGWVETDCEPWAVLQLERLFGD